MSSGDKGSRRRQRNENRTCMMRPADYGREPRVSEHPRGPARAYLPLAPCS